jgi:hypothetical protein
MMVERCRKVRRDLLGVAPLDVLSLEQMDQITSLEQCNLPANTVAR